MFVVSSFLFVESSARYLRRNQRIRFKSKSRPMLRSKFGNVLLAAVLISAWCSAQEDAEEELERLPGLNFIGVGYDVLVCFSRVKISRNFINEFFCEKNGNIARERSLTPFSLTCNVHAIDEMFCWHFLNFATLCLRTR